jgi:predicted small lipoprotein YifL
MSRFLPLLLCILLSLPLLGCGQKGDLYLPEPQQAEDQDDEPNQAR